MDVEDASIYTTISNWHLCSKCPNLLELGIKYSDHTPAFQTAPSLLQTLPTSIQVLNFGGFRCRKRQEKEMRKSLGRFTQDMIRTLPKLCSIGDSQKSFDEYLDASDLNPLIMHLSLNGYIRNLCLPDSPEIPTGLFPLLLEQGVKVYGSGILALAEDI